MGHAIKMVPYGYAVAAVEYRLSGEANYPAQLHDLKGAIRWLRANASTYRLDAQRIVGWGASAGGLLVSVLGLTANRPELEGEVGGNLTTAGGWLAGDPKNYDRKLALYPEDVIGWIKDTQPAEYDKVKSVNNGSTDTLILDEDGVYDGHDPNDRLLLGLKGILSEMELHIMRNRLERGRDNQARRGELFHGVPMGYVLLPSEELDFDPDEQARAVVQRVFDKFAELGSIYGVLYWLLKNDIQLPIRARTGAKKGQLDWRRPSSPTLAQMLRHPIYAGAYA